MSSFVRSYAINQFNKEFPIEKANSLAHNKVLYNVQTVNEVYRPHRYYRRKNAPPPDLVSRVQITLLEYGLQGEIRKKAVANDANGLNVSDGDVDEVTCVLYCFRCEIHVVVVKTFYLHFAVCSCMW